MNSLKLRMLVMRDRLIRSITKKKIVTGMFLVIGIFIVYMMTDLPPTDYVFTMGAFVLTAHLLPTILNEESVIFRWTSIPTALVVLSFAVSFYHIGYHLSAIGNFTNFIAWMIVAIFRGPNIEKGEIEKFEG